MTANPSRPSDIGKFMFSDCNIKILIKLVQVGCANSIYRLAQVMMRTH